MSDTESQFPVPVFPGKRVPAWRNPWLLVALLALVLAFWQWFETRSRLQETEKAIAEKLQKTDAEFRQTRSDATKAQEQVQKLSVSVGSLEAKMAEFQGQTIALQTLYNELAKSRDEASLLEIEQAVTLAAQQLQLAGNVQTAVLALQAADAKLAVLNRPQFVPLRRALGRDLDRLRAVPSVDLPGMSVKLESLASSIEELPLAMETRPQAAQKDAAKANDQQASWWRRVSGDVWQEIKGLVRIQRFDRSEPVLLAPGQGFFLRENLKLRLLNARLALLSRDQSMFRKDLKTAQEWIGQHFDVHDKRVQNVQSNLKQFSGTDINIELPNLNESLGALRLLKNPKEKR